VVERCVADIRGRLNSKFQKLPINFFGEKKQGQLISVAINDTYVMAYGFKFGVDLIREPLAAIGLISVALYQDWRLTLIIFAIVPLFIAVFTIAGKKVKHYETKVRDETGNINHDLSESINGQKIIKAFNLQNYAQNRFLNTIEKYIYSWKRFAFFVENSSPAVELIGAIGFGAIVIYASHRIGTGELTTGGFMSFIAAMAMFMDPIRKFSDANLRINQAMAASERIFPILDEADEKDDGTIEKKDFEAGIDFKNVTFSYGEGDVIKDFDLFVKKGERVALVGLSGSGKSTMINLLLRLYPVIKGDITIDGVPLNDIKLTDLRNLFSLVSQDIFLFNDTIRENITVGRDIDENDLKQALDISYCTEFVAKLPEQLETVLGDRGTRLSGGQSQRLTIARAFLNKSPILLFDEATSALDNESEKTVQKALDQVAGDKTVIAVAHRLSTIQNYDKIVVMNEGRKVEEGTHEELMKLKGEYFKLYELSSNS
jgi:subfamily B ATP-binding cassette protein MsbA